MSTDMTHPTLPNDNLVRLVQCLTVCKIRQETGIVVGHYHKIRTEKLGTHCVSTKNFILNS